MKAFRILLALITFALIIFALGPNPDSGQYTDGLSPVTDTGVALQQWVATKEAREKTKPDNEARIIWHDDSSKTRTEYAVVYLHGFTASQEEGDPVHANFARSIGANLYLSRLSEHGKDTSAPLYNMTATSLWESAKEAFAIGKQLGNKVILMGTSTGGTLALMLAAEQYPEIAGLVLLSPNIEINDNMAFLANDNWGLQIARVVMKSDMRTAADERKEYKQYWNYQYRLEAVVQLQQMLEDKMTPKTFSSVSQPVLMLYYYKDESHQDPVVRVSAMKSMFESLSTPVEKKRAVAVPEAGDHVIGSYIKSRDYATVENEAIRFAKDMGWKK
jgi:esterase/lipase